jgi:hypothetical protein
MPTVLSIASFGGMLAKQGASHVNVCINPSALSHFIHTLLLRQATTSTSQYSSRQMMTPARRPSREGEPATKHRTGEWQQSNTGQLAGLRFPVLSSYVRLVVPMEETEQKERKKDFCGGVFDDDGQMICLFVVFRGPIDTQSHSLAMVFVQQDNRKQDWEGQTKSKSTRQRE